MPAAVEIDGLGKRFGDIEAVRALDLTVQRGDVLGFLGPNGAGKSTTMKMVAGYLEPTTGTVRIDDIDVVEDPLSAQRGLGYLPEGAPAYGEMSVGGFLDFIAAIRGFDGAERRRRVDGAVERTSLGDVLGQAIDTLSKGYKRRVGLAQAILHDPGVLILDEPTDGLDPVQKHHVRRLIRDMAQDKAIVISTHILEEVDAICNRAAIIVRGRLVLDSTPDELARQAPNHNAVVVTVASQHVDSVRSLGGVLNGVRGVEPVDVSDGRARLRLLPAGSVALAPVVNEELRKRDIEALELYVERGGLEQVFREVAGDA